VALAADANHGIVANLTKLRAVVIAFDVIPDRLNPDAATISGGYG
jgi:hypothetical protein